jgi:hypothetical protein
MTDEKGLPTVNSKAVYDSTEIPFITTSCLRTASIFGLFSRKLAASSFTRFTIVATHVL